MSDPWRTARFLWIGPRLSPIEQLSLASHVRQGWDVQLFLYGPCEGVPSGVAIRDGREVLMPEMIFPDPANEKPGASYANFSDLFRWRLLSSRAGWWFDMDMVALSGPRSLDGPRFASTWEGEFGQCAITCAMYSDGQTPLLQQAFEDAMFIVSSGRDRSFPEIGPFLLQRLIRESGLQQAIAPWWEFCPFPWRQIQTACSPDAKTHVLNQLRVVKHTLGTLAGSQVRPARIRRGTTSVHLHNEIWRRAGISKTGPFSRWSFIGGMLRKLSISVS
jgi:hypothetical protein